MQLEARSRSAYFKLREIFWLFALRLRSLLRSSLRSARMYYGLGVTVGVVGMDITTSTVLGKMDSTSTLPTSTSHLGVS